MKCMQATHRAARREAVPAYHASRHGEPAYQLLSLSPGGPTLRVSAEVLESSIRTVAAEG